MAVGGGVIVIGRQPIHRGLVNLVSAVSHFSDFPLSSTAPDKDAVCAWTRSAHKPRT
jgi:hypothetical protein